MRSPAGGSFVSFPILLFTGVQAVEANATNTVALWPGLAASTIVFLKRLDAPLRLLIPLILTSLAGGWVRRAVAASHAATHIPASGAVVAFERHAAVCVWKSDSSDRGPDFRCPRSPAIIVAGDHGEFRRAVAVGGVRGILRGGQLGFVILGMLAALGMRDVLAMGAIRTLLAAARQRGGGGHVHLRRGGAVAQCLVMLAGSDDRRMVWGAFCAKSGSTENAIRGHRGGTGDERVFFCRGALKIRGLPARPQRS